MSAYMWFLVVIMVRHNCLFMEMSLNFHSCLLVEHEKQHADNIAITLLLYVTLPCSCALDYDIRNENTFFYRFLV